MSKFTIQGTSMLPLQEAQVRSLVWEPRSLTLCSMAKNKINSLYISPSEYQVSFLKKKNLISPNFIKRLISRMLGLQKKKTKSLKREKKKI